MFFLVELRMRVVVVVIMYERHSAILTLVYS